LFAVTLVIVGALAFPISAGAEGPPPVGLLPAEIAQWNEGLSKAGASSVEIGQFAELSLQSPAGWMHCGDRSKSAILRQVFASSSATGGAAENPQALFKDNVPIRSCDSLLEASIPNTKIDATNVDALDGSCRVTASVTHPPASDRVRVFVALPRTPGMAVFGNGRRRVLGWN